MFRFLKRIRLWLRWTPTWWVAVLTRKLQEVLA